MACLSKVSFARKRASVSARLSRANQKLISDSCAVLEATDGNLQGNATFEHDGVGRDGQCNCTGCEPPVVLSHIPAMVGWFWI